MGFFSWLKDLFFGGLPQKKTVEVRPPVPLARPGPTFTKPAGGPPPIRTDYAAEEFAPISDKELRDKSKAKEVATSPWWGRTDTIPPGDDVRTKLIDRALVTRGYLTPEQLVEIHRVGDL